ncbi:MAG: hypothetical protein AMXMBFR84_48130 [Candidatus Hydrogenedentota bacterium]
MPSIQSIIHDLSDTTIADRVTSRHDDARNHYHLRQNRVPNWDDFRAVTGDYYAHHYTSAVTRGGSIERGRAAARAKAILDREYRRRGLGYVAAVNDGIYGTNGGMKTVIDLIAEGIKAQDVSDYYEAVFDAQIKGNVYEDKVAIIRDVFHYYGPVLADTVDLSNPARYANDYRVIIDALVENMRRTSPVFRQL